MEHILGARQILQHISNVGKGDTGNSSYGIMRNTSSCSPTSSTPGKGPAWEADCFGGLHPGNAPTRIWSSLLGIFSCNI
jgi:hypothetical protein